MRHHTRAFKMSKMLKDSKCGILKKEQYFADAKSWIMNHAYTEQPFLVAIRGKMYSTGHCIGIMQNMAVDATLMDDIELS